MFCGAKLLKKIDVRKCARHFSSFPSIFPHFCTPTQARELYSYLLKYGAKTIYFVQILAYLKILLYLCTRF